MSGAESPVAETSTHHLFVYGSLVDPRCLDGVLGHAHQGERLEARLSGFQRVRMPEYGYPFAVAETGAWVDGVLVMDLTAYDMQALDRYEEVDAGTYERRLVEVEAWGCGPRAIHVQAYTYVAGRALVALTVR
jgi:gamma-glutamylcyclotransferase (GGCT)/AIG2-like uncharacterized protein YtfP